MGGNRIEKGFRLQFFETNGLQFACLLPGSAFSARWSTELARQLHGDSPGTICVDRPTRQETGRRTGFTRTKSALPTLYATRLLFGRLAAVQSPLVALFLSRTSSDDRRRARAHGLASRGATG